MDIDRVSQIRKSFPDPNGTYLLSLAVMGSISSQRKISLFPEGSHEAGPCTHTAEFAPGLGAKFSQIARAKVGQALPLQMTP